MKLTSTTFVSVDGVMQGIGAPDEDPSGEFERGGWTTPLFDNETGTYLTEIYQRADAFLFGRRTYEIFARSWGAVADPSMNAVAESLHSRPKYVASTTLTETQWANTTVLSSEIAAAVDELRAKPGGELLVPGSGALIRWLLANDLVDQMDLLIFPVVVGQGTRLFPDTGPDRALELVESRATPPRRDDPGLPARRALAVRDVHGRPTARAVSQTGRPARKWESDNRCDRPSPLMR